MFSLYTIGRLRGIAQRRGMRDRTPSERAADGREYRALVRENVGPSEVDIRAFTAQVIARKPVDRDLYNFACEVYQASK